MEIPIYTFWELFNNAYRIKAEDDKRNYTSLLNAVSAVFGGDAQKHYKELDRQIGAVVIQSADVRKGFDKNALSALKALMGHQ